MSGNVHDPALTPEQAAQLTKGRRGPYCRSERSTSAVSSSRTATSAAVIAALSPSSHGVAWVRPLRPSRWPAEVRQPRRRGPRVRTARDRRLGRRYAARWRCRASRSHAGRARRYARAGSCRPPPGGRDLSGVRRLDAVHLGTAPCSRSWAGTGPPSCRLCAGVSDPGSSRGRAFAGCGSTTARELPLPR